MKLTEQTENRLRYLLLITLLGILVYAVPLLWELGLVGAIGGAIWIFVWPKPEKASDNQAADQ